MSSLKVCESFFNFDGNFNRGHDVVSALYHLIHNCKEKNYVHFKYLEKQIYRSSKGLSTCEDFDDLLKLALCNVTDDYKGNDVCWTLVGYMFYVSEKVDYAAQRSLDPIQYRSFKKHMISYLSQKLTNVFGENLTETTWKYFSMRQTLNSIQVKPFNWFSFGLGLCSAYVANKLMD